MKLERAIGGILLFVMLMGFAQARIPYRESWNRTFYTDDSSLYLNLYPDGFKQLVRVSAETCNQISNINVLIKGSAKKNFSTFKLLDKKNAPSLYGLPKENYCWFEVSARGIGSLSSNIKYALQIEDTDHSITYFKGITNSLIPFYRLSNDEKIDAWIDLGAFGATPVIGGGVFYKVWEPLAEEVHLFINQGSALKLNAEYSKNDERRFHYAYIPDSKVKDQYHYQFVKNGVYENLEVANFKTFSAIKVDPMAREITYDAKGGRFNGYINPRGLVTSDQQYSWKNDQAFADMSAQDFNNWIIYQLWTLTFNPRVIDGSYVQGRFLDIIPKIPYLEDLGVNAVELLPVHEGRFDASWGYALDSLIALEGTLGSRSDMKRLVDELHAKKLRILFDVVLNHVNNNLLREPINAIVSTSKFYSGDTPWGPKPRFESIWVRKWMTDSLIHLMNEYHLDGFRFDMTDSIFNGTKGGYRFLQELMYLIKMNNPRFYNSAEQLPNNVWVTFPSADNGIGFDSQWNDRFKNFFELEFDNYSDKDRSVDLTHLSEALLGFSDHEAPNGDLYHFGHPMRTVNYLGSHDFIGNKDPIVRIVTKYHQTEREDDNVFSRVNPLEESGDLRIPFRTIHNQFSHALSRLSYGILFTKPGASLFYQGEELAQDLNIENEWAYVNATQGNRFPSKDISINKYVKSHRMTWHYLDLIQGKKNNQLSFVTPEETQLFSGQLTFFKEMIRFKKDNPEFNNRDAENVRIDNQNKIVTYELKNSQSWYFVVGNFNTDNGGAWIDFPGDHSIWWREHLNSSDKRFGGNSEIFRNVISNLGGRKNLLRLKGPGFYLFKAENAPEVLERLYFRSSAFGWKASPETELMVNTNNAEELFCILDFEKEQSLDFKIASGNWDIDLGKSQTDKVLSYIPNSPNIKMKVVTGKYMFRFNIRSFTYSFDKI